MITREAIYHLPKSSYCYAYDKDTIHIRIRTKYNECNQILLIYGDPYDGAVKEIEGVQTYCWHNHKIPMMKSGSTKYYDYWTAQIKPSKKRLRYGFLLNSATDCVFLGDRGIVEIEDQTLPQDIGEYFAFPFMNAIDIFEGPSWVKNTIWYQIFPERFCNGNPDNDPAHTLDWGSIEPTPENFFGGDLEGVIKQLDYLKDLGINGIYFTPIFTSPTNHKYDTTDYLEIDPHFGTKETLKKLIDEAHKRDIKIMLDAVFNHAGWTFKPWQDVLKNGSESKYKDWFYIHQFPLFPDNIDPFNLKTSGEANFKNLGYDTFAFTPYMPKFNTENQDVRNYLLSVAAYYAREFEIDAWRLDVANEVSHDFWREFRKTLKSINPDLYIVGEVWHQATPWLLGDQFDSVMNYPLSNAIIDYIAKDKINGAEFGEALVNQSFSYSQNVSQVMFNVLDSHDTPRVLTQCDHNKDKAKLAFVILLSQIGSPCIYYGTEIGMDGGQDPGCRKCMVWDEKKQDRHMYHHMQKLIKLRKQYSSMTQGQLVIIDSCSETNHIIYAKKYQHEKLIFIIHNHAKINNIDLPLELKNRTVYDLYHDEKIELAHTLKMKPYSFKILKL